MSGEITVAVRVKPGAPRTRVAGSYPGPYGPALVVAVTARAVDGRATEAARRALADALGVRPAAVALRTGAASRDKLFTVAAASAAVADRLTALRDGEPGPGQRARWGRPAGAAPGAGPGVGPGQGSP